MEPRLNRLQLNASKSELLWCATALWQYQLPFVEHSVLGLTLSFHRRRCATSAFSSIRDLIMRSHVQLEHSWTMVIILLANLSNYLLSRLQSVINAAARSIAGLSHSDHITDTLARFYWSHVYA